MLLRSIEVGERLLKLIRLHFVLFLKVEFYALQNTSDYFNLSIYELFPVSKIQSKHIRFYLEVSISLKFAVLSSIT